MITREEIKALAIKLAAECGCRSWVTHKGLAHTMLEKAASKR